MLGNSEFILKVPNSSARMDIKLGNEINIGWDSHDCRALDPKYSLQINILEPLQIKYYKK
jgi:hypothetical protein